MRAGHLKLEPIPVGRPWGGRALEELFGKPGLSGGAPVGESWEATDVEGLISRVKSGPRRGERATDVLGGPLPLLVKLLDCREMLSLQVHPDEEAARALGGAARPKSEAWWVLRAEAGAFVWCGTRPGVTAEALLDACRRGAPEPLLRRVPIAAGDALFVPAGTVHAIGPGALLYEVQQPSDSTYRLFDWGRRGPDGKPRALHLAEAAASLREGARAFFPALPRDASPAPRRSVFCEPAFRLDLVALEEGERAPLCARETGPAILTAIEGAGRVRSALGEEPLGAGETFLLLPGAEAEVEGAGPRGLRLLEASA